MERDNDIVLSKTVQCRGCATTSAGVIYPFASTLPKGWSYVDDKNNKNVKVILCPACQIRYSRRR